MLQEKFDEFIRHALHVAGNVLFQPLNNERSQTIQHAGVCERRRGHCFTTRQAHLAAVITGFGAVRYAWRCRMVSRPSARGRSALHG
ncbi:MAG: hypothetical protein KA354_14330 [Phycisphaerae bacterium]|nr:hypothetical protein [Phycisphaerae bacterium]